MWPFAAIFPEGVANAAGDEVHIRVIEACLGVQFDRAERALSVAMDGAYDAMSGAVADRIAAVGSDNIDLYDPRPALVAAHARWTESRTADCDVLAASYFGGTGATYEGLTCSLNATRSRVDWASQVSRQYLPPTE